MLGKKHLGNERIYRKRMFANLELKSKFQKIWGNHLHPKVRENALTLTFYLRTGPAHKNRKRLVLLTWLKLCDSRKIHCLTSEFHVKFHLKNRYRTWNLTWNSFVRQWIFLYYSPPLRCIIVEYLSFLNKKQTNKDVRATESDGTNKQTNDRIKSFIEGYMDE